MVYIFTALYPEARPLIQYFDLVKDTEHTRFQTFFNEEKRICLTITGIGSIAAATAVASICTEHGIKGQDFLINIGTCAEMNNGISAETNIETCMRVNDVVGKANADAPGKIFLCSKIVEQCTEKTFYPDMLYRHGFDEAGIVTGSKLLDVQNSSRVLPVEQEMCLYDMEAAAIYQAGSYFFGPHQMSFLKLVSDAGAAGTVTAHQAEKLIETHIEDIAAYIRLLSNIAETEQQQERELSGQAMAWVEKLSADLHCSKVMQDSLRQHIRYLELSGIHYEDILCKMYEEGQLPCKDKREGKVRFDELKRKLL